MLKILLADTSARLLNVNSPLAPRGMTWTRQAVVAAKVRRWSVGMFTFQRSIWRPMRTGCARRDSCRRVPMAQIRHTSEILNL